MAAPGSTASDPRRAAVSPAGRGPALALAHGLTGDRTSYGRLPDRAYAGPGMQPADGPPDRPPPRRRVHGEVARATLSSSSQPPGTRPARRGALAGGGGGNGRAVARVESRNTRPARSALMNAVVASPGSSRAARFRQRAGRRRRVLHSTPFHRHVDVHALGPAGPDRTGQAAPASSPANQPGRLATALRTRPPEAGRCRAPDGSGASSPPP